MIYFYWDNEYTFHFVTKRGWNIHGFWERNFKYNSYKRYLNTRLLQNMLFQELTMNSCRTFIVVDLPSRSPSRLTSPSLPLFRLSKQSMTAMYRLPSKIIWLSFATVLDASWCGNRDLASRKQGLGSRRLHDRQTHLQVPIWGESSWFILVSEKCT